MANPNPRKELLQPVRTKEEARIKGRAGGIKSVQVRREKKLISEEYGKALANAHNLNGKGVSLHKVVEELLLQGSVQMMKEIREATEGSKVHQTGEMDSNITIKFE